MQSTKQEFPIHLMAAIILYVAVLIYQGYQYGQGDQSQILPVLYALDHPETYVNDHYVNAFLQSNINERTLFHALFRYMGYDNPWFVFLWHAISGIALILAWIFIVGNFIKNKALQWLSIGFILTVGFHTSTGSNELYYNQFIPSLPAKALASWALLFWLKNKYLWWAILLILSGYLQPLVGFQLFLLTAAALFFEHSRSRTFREFPWKYLVVYGIATLPWIILLWVNNGGHNDPDAFMNIMEFRLSHHFFGAYFEKVHLALGLLFACISILFYKDRLRWVFICIIAGFFIYEIGVEIFRSPFVLYSQWWKTTIWMEAFAFIAVMPMVEKYFPLTERLQKFSLTIPFVLFLFVSFYRLTGLFGDRPLYMQPLNHHTPDEVDISEQALKLTPANSIFIIPPELSAFRWYSKRSSYVDYKAMIHSETFLNEWYRRIGEVYNNNLSAIRSGISIEDASASALTNPSLQTIQNWKNFGVSHLIAPNTGSQNVQLLGYNKKFSLFMIP